MTPQLQQAIKLLQLASIELQNEIQSVLDSNPMLEVEEDNENGASNDEQGSAEPLNDYNVSNEPSSGNGAAEAVTDTSETSWENDWTTSYQSSSTQSNDSNTPDREIYERQDFSETSLHEHLQWQLHLTHMSPTDRAIAVANPLRDFLEEVDLIH
jgi:RNA polymerase sigma-54 factor